MPTGGDPRALDDAILAGRCAARDPGAWSELLDRGGPAARGMMRRVFARSGVPDPAREADEAMGDLAAALLDRDAALLRAYRPPAPLRAYLAVIGRTVAIRLMRRRLRARSLDAPAPGGTALRDLLEAPAGGGEGLPEPRALEAAMGTLPPRDRLMLRLVYWDGLSYAEAGRVLGLAPGSLGPLLSGCRSALRSALRNRENTVRPGPPPG